MRGQDDLTLSVSSLCLRLVAGQKMKSNHRHVLREGLGIALLLETLMPCLHYCSTLMRGGCSEYRQEMDRAASFDCPRLIKRQAGMARGRSPLQPRGPWEISITTSELGKAMQRGLTLENSCC